MTQRNSQPRPYLTHAHRNVRAEAHSLLEAELQDIRRSLARLERELSGNVVEMRAPRQIQTKNEAA